MRDSESQYSVLGGRIDLFLKPTCFRRKSNPPRTFFPQGSQTMCLPRSTLLFKDDEILLLLVYYYSENPHCRFWNVKNCQITIKNMKFITSVDQDISRVSEANE